MMDITRCESVKSSSLKENLKRLKIPSITVLLVVVLSACNLPLSTQTSGQDLPGMTQPTNVQADPALTRMTMTAPTYGMPMMNPTSMPALMPPNIPVWSAYNYTCEPADGGGNMTMNLNWTDRSSGEESYRVYRDKQLIATLLPNSTSYVDVVFIAQGKTASYSVEAFNETWQASTSTITNGCQ